jgi:chromosome segregation ATPase
MKEKWEVFLKTLQKQQTDVLSESLTQRKEVITSFNGFMNDLEAREKIFLKDLSSVLDLLSVEKLGKDIKNSVALTGQNLQKSVGTHIEKITDRFLLAGNEMRSEVKKEFSELSDKFIAVKQSQERLNNTIESIVSPVSALSTQLKNTDKQMTVFEQLKSSLLATFLRVEKAQKTFQDHIEESITRLHTVPLDDRLAHKLAKATDKTISPVNSNLWQVSTKLKQLDISARSIMTAVENINRVFAGRYFKISYQILICVGIVAALSLICVASLGVISLFKL